MTSYLCGFIVHTRWVQNIWVTTPLSSQVGPSDTIQKWSQPSGHCTVHLLWLYAFSCRKEKKERREQQHNVFYLFCVISGLQKNITVAKWQRKWQLKIFDSWFLNRDSWIDSTTTSFKLSTLSPRTLRGVKEKSCTWSLKKYEFM